MSELVRISTLAMMRARLVVLPFQYDWLYLKKNISLKISYSYKNKFYLLTVRCPKIEVAFSKITFRGALNHFRAYVHCMLTLGFAVL